MQTIWLIGIFCTPLVHNSIGASFCLCFFSWAFAPYSTHKTMSLIFFWVSVEGQSPNTAFNSLLLLDGFCLVEEAYIS